MSGYIFKSNLYLNNHSWCEINFESLPFKCQWAEPCHSHPQSRPAQMPRKMPELVFTHQHKVLFPFEVKHSVNISAFSLTWTDIKGSRFYPQGTKKSQCFYWFLTIKWTYKSCLKWQAPKTFSAAGNCLTAVTSQLPATLLQRNTSQLNGHHMQPEQTHPHSVSKEQLPDPKFYLCMMIQVGTWQFLTNPIHFFFWVHWINNCLYPAT